MQQSLVIVGGGIGGLAAALALGKLGIHCHVYERAPVLSEVGAGITLWNNATRVLAWLGLLDRIEAAGAVMTKGILGRHDGAVLSRSDWEQALGSEVSTRVLALHRAELQQALYDALGPERVTLGAACTGWSPGSDGVTVHFEGRPDVQARLLVGADGVKSRVREVLLADGPPRYSGYTCWRGIAPDMHDWPGPGGEIWGPGRRFGIVPIGSGRLYWFATHNQPAGQPDPPETRKARVADLFSGWGHGVPELIERTPDDAILHNDLVDRPPVRGWSRGPVVLLGDAVHPTTPNMGQGAAMAIESAAVLARCLSEGPDHTTAFRRFEAARAERTAKITNDSWSIGRVAQWEAALPRWLRDTALRLAPPSLQAGTIRAVVRYDATTAPLPAA